LATARPAMHMTDMSIATHLTLARELDSLCGLQTDIIALLGVIGDCPLLDCRLRDRAELHAVETRAQQALLQRHRRALGVADALPPTDAAAGCPPVFARSGAWLISRWRQLELLEIRTYQMLVACVTHADMPDLLSGCASALDLQRALLEWLTPFAQPPGSQEDDFPAMQGAAHANHEPAGIVHS